MWLFDGQWPKHQMVLTDVLGDAHVDVSSGLLPLLYWEKFMLFKGVISLYQKAYSGEGACLKPDFLFLNYLYSLLNLLTNFIECLVKP